MTALLLAAGLGALAASNGASATAAPSDIVGAWTDGMATLNLMPEGHFAAVYGNGIALGLGTYEAGDGTITVTDRDGFARCDAAATYGYAISGDTVTFTKMEDVCEGRIEALDGTRWSRLPMPSFGD